MAITAEKLRVEVEGDTSKAVEALDTLEEKGSSVPKWVGGAKSALMGLFGVGAGAGLAFSAGLLGNITATEATNKVSAALDLTTAQSKVAGDTAGALFADAYTGSMSEASTAVESVMSSVDGMKNANAETLKGATADVLNFAKAYEVDVDRAAQVAGQAVRQGLAPDFDSAMDLMVASSSKVPKALRGDLMDAVDEYGGYFSQVGISGEQAFSMLAAASQKGMYGIDKTGDAIKELSVRIVESDKTAAGALDGMGLSMSDLADDMAAGGERGNKAMGSIVDGLLGIKDPGQRAAAAIDLFGAPLEDLGTNNIPKFLQSLKGVDGGLGDVGTASERMGEKLNSGPGVALEQLKNSVTTAFIGFTDVAIPAVTKFATTASTLVGPAVQAIGDAASNTLGFIASMVNFIRDNSTVFTIIAGIIAAVFVPGLISMGVQAGITKAKVVGAWIAQKAAAVGSVAAQSLAMAKTAAGWVAMGIRATAGAARVVAGWVLAAATSVAQGAIMAASMAATVARVVAGWVLMGVQSMIQAARMAAAWLIAMGPVGWIIATVIALVAIIIANWDKIKAVTTAVFSAVAKFVSDIWKKISAWVAKAITATKAKIASTMKAIQDTWNSIWNRVASIAKGLWNGIKAIISGAINAVKSTVSNVVNRIKSTWQSVMTGIRNIARSIWEGIKAVIRNAIQNVLDRVNRIRQVAETVRNAFRAAKDKAVSVLKGLIDYVRGVPKRLIGFFTGAISTFRNAGSNIINGLKEGILGAFGNVKNAVKNGLSKVRNLLPFSPAKEGPFSGKGWTLYSGRSIPEAMADGIRDRIGEARSAALEMAKATQDAMILQDTKGRGLGLGGLTRPRAGNTSPRSLMIGTPAPARMGPNITFNTYNPIAEKDSLTVNKNLQRYASLDW